jgi:HSP20 family protein
LIRDELVYSGFRRNFDVGDTVDPENISAEYADGTLKVVLPKKESQKTQRIPITAAS